MIASLVARRRIGGSVYYGWWVVGVAFLSLFISGMTNGFTFSIFLPAMNAELGWSRSTIVVASSLASIVGALTSPLLGRFADKRGTRLLLVFMVLSMALGFTLSGLSRSPWQFFLAYGVLSGTARMALNGVLPGAMVSQWFIRKRSTAYGWAALGPPMSNLLMPPLVTAVVAAFSWRAGWFTLSTVSLVLGLAPALLLTARRPRDLGLLPDGDTPEVLSVSSDADPYVRDPKDWTAREALHSYKFWMVAAGTTLILLAPNTAVVFMFSFLTSRGAPAGIAAAVISGIAAMQLITRVTFWAPLIARTGSVRWVVVIWGALLTLSAVCLCLAVSPVLAYIGAAVLGLAMGGNLVLQLQIWPEYFGRSAVGTIIGIGQLLQGITIAVIPLALAALLDRTGSYALLFGATAALVGAGLLLHLKVGKPDRPVHTQVS